MLYTDGGTAIDITEGSQITGDGKLVAIGGDVLWGNGGNAVSGKGTIATKKVFLQGATANTSNKAEAGKAIDGDVKVISSSTHIEDGTMISGAENDPLADLYWKAGINVLPPLENLQQQITEIMVPIMAIMGITEITVPIMAITGINGK